MLSRYAHLLVLHDITGRWKFLQTELEVLVQEEDPSILEAETGLPYF